MREGLEERMLTHMSNYCVFKKILYSEVITIQDFSKYTIDIE